MISIWVLAMTLAGTPFPLPTIDGKQISVMPGQRRFRLPMRFATARAFFDAQLLKTKAKRQTLSVAGRSKIEFTCTEPSPVWLKATLTEGDVDTLLEIVPVLRTEAMVVEGTGKPLVQFVLGRSSEVEKSLEQTDPLERLR
jgi:alpha-D-ribose 1-methylphosphonate 5-triphosphate synthase subunit PhnH